jgi:branched-subunit amino acid transport protein AzlD
MEFHTTLLVILVAAAATLLTRSIPFLLFGRKRTIPKSISYLGAMLPHAVMAALLVYCLKAIDFTATNLWLHEVLAVLHWWRRNTLLSIVVGTASYMLLTQGLLGI